MGAWGSGVFENDCALDWVDDLEEFNDLSLIVSMLKAALTDDLVVHYDTYVNSEIMEIAPAAAETVAALSGHPGTDLPQQLQQWLALHQLLIDEETRKLAIKVVERTLKATELREIWATESDYDLWKQGIEDLLARLQT
ncbi:MAG: DUF4259 domain-containing protein [Chloroflexota bacterium]